MINIKRISSIEEYKDVKERYYITTCGKVISMKNKKIKILKPKINKYGYEKIILRKTNGRKIDILVHRLVAFAFIDNTENKPQINHKNEIKTDNYVKNLEWVTRSENVNYGTRNERASKAMKGKYAGCKSYKAKSKEYYASNARLRGNFKKICKSQGWQFDDFEEIFSGWHYHKIGKRERKYLYILKDIE